MSRITLYLLFTPVLRIFLFIYFGKKFKLEYTVRIGVVESGDGSTNLERMERHNIRHNEADALIDKVYLDNLIENKLESLRSKETFDVSLLQQNLIRKNTLQLLMIDSKFNINTSLLTKYQFLVLLYTIHFELLELNLEVLDKVIMGYPLKPIEEIKLIKHKGYLDNLNKTELYNKVLEKFHFFNDNYILKILSGVYYNEWSDREGNLIFDKIDINHFTLDFLSYISYI